MKTAEQLMKKKAFIKKEMDKVMPQNQSNTLWQVPIRRLQAILNHYGELPAGVQSHTDSIFPAAAVYLTVKKKYGKETAYKIIENAAISLCGKSAPILAKIKKFAVTE